MCELKREAEESGSSRTETKIIGRNGREGERGKKMTQGHTATRHREEAEHVGKVQYVLVIAKKVGMHTAAALTMIDEETVVKHSDRNSHQRA